MSLGDPSRERDFESKETATARFAESAAERRIQSDDLAGHVQRLSADVRILADHLEINTGFTKEVSDKGEAIRVTVDGIRAQGDATQAAVVKLQEDTAAFLAIFSAMQGGFKVLGWLGAFAKWVGAIGGGLAILWAIWAKK